MIPDAVSSVTDFVSLDSQQIAELRDRLVGFTETLAATSRGSLIVVYLVTFLNVTSLAFFQWYFVVYHGHSWLWTPVPLILLLIPTMVIWIYHHILSAVSALPNQIADTADDAIRSVSGYSEEMTELSRGGLTLFKRWRSYLFLGKVLWKMQELSDETTGIIGAFGLVALMINPIFWLILLISVIVSFALSALLMLVCAIQWYFF